MKKNINKEIVFSILLGSLMYMLGDMFMILSSKQGIFPFMKATGALITFLALLLWLGNEVGKKFPYHSAKKHEWKQYFWLLYLLVCLFGMALVYGMNLVPQKFFGTGIMLTALLMVFGLFMLARTWSGLSNTKPFILKPIAGGYQYDDQILSNDNPKCQRIVFPHLTHKEKE